MALLDTNAYSSDAIALLNNVCCPLPLPQAQDQGGPQPPAGLARQKLQQILAAELAREGERAAMLQGVADEGDKQRLLHMFEQERHSAMILMQRLQLQ